MRGGNDKIGEITTFYETAIIEYYKIFCDFHALPCPQGVYNNHARGSDGRKHATHQTHHQCEYHPHINNVEVQREAEGEF